MKFDQDKLDKLKRCIEKYGIKDWNYSRKPKSFAQAVLKDPELTNLASRVELDKLPDSTVKRCDVHNFVQRNDTDALNKVLFLLAWGGMYQMNAKSALKSYKNYWREIVEEMLEDKRDRVQAYKRFHSQVREKKLKGMGPAYFTKLIYFLQPNHNGYIMDQWTARSMNFLRKNSTCKIHLIPTSRRKNNKELRNFRIDPIKNDHSTYSAFCEDLECLAECLGKSAEETEMSLFSNGGNLNNMGCWRRIVLEKTS